LKCDGFGWALLDASPAFDAVFGPDRDGIIPLDLVNVARADLNTILAGPTLLFVDEGIHNSKLAWGTGQRA
jgi:hypothetical protein